MKFNFRGDVEEVTPGIEILSNELKFNISEDGISVYVHKRVGELKCTFKEGCAIIEYEKKSHFFRLIGILCSSSNESKFCEIVETPQFKSLGCMIDASRNAVIKPGMLKKLIIKLALMGYQFVMLYTEDTYTIESEPYFGYLRGRYSHQEIKEIDDFAEIFGIEIIPCIQTLAHLRAFLRWDVADDIKDTADILLAGNPETYEFIENMILNASKPVRSKRIHIGMDEAWGVGLGNYLSLNGYQNSSDILRAHLEKVYEICKSNGLSPMMWSDMFFQVSSQNSLGGNFAYDGKPDINLKQWIPEDLQLVYWDYESTLKEKYVLCISEHKKIGQTPLFAGGIWMWNMFGVNYGKSLIETNSALMACKEEGVNEVFATLWMDDGAESNVFAALLGLSLYAEHAYNYEVDLKKLKDSTFLNTEISYDDYMLMKEIDEIPGGLPDNINSCNPSKCFLWQDPLLGLFDLYADKFDYEKHYSRLADRLSEAKSRSNLHSYIFTVPESLCRVLAVKTGIGNIIQKAYSDNDSDDLEHICHSVLPELYRLINQLRISHRKQWMFFNKPFGWEVLDIRYGGLLSRIDSSINRIDCYINGSIDKIDELEQEKLYFNYKDNAIRGKTAKCNQYSAIVTPGALSQVFGSF